MKDLSPALLAHLAHTSTTLAQGWKVTRSDGNVYGFSDHDRDILIAGVTYRASEGLQPTAAHSSDDLKVNTLDVTAFLDVSTEAEMLAGVWDDAEVVNFEVNWSAPPAAFDNNLLILLSGTLGQITLQNGVFTAEVRSLSQKLSRRIGRQYSPTCPWIHARWNGTTYVPDVECSADLTGLIHTGTITSVSSDPTREFSDSGQAQVDGYFNTGLLTFTSGPNAGITREVRRWQNQLFSVWRPFPYPVDVGATYSAVHGDDKVFSTCKDVFNNFVSFGGFPHLPGVDQVYAAPTAV